MKIFNAALGGKIRAVLAIVVAVATAVLAIIDKVDWDATPGAILIAIIAAIAQFTPIGEPK